MHPQAEASSASETEGIGLSDASEAAAWAKAHGLNPLGEVLFEQDLHDLGLAE